MKQFGCIVPVSGILLIAMLVFAWAKDQPETIPCWKVKSYIFIYGQQAAWVWATSHYNSDQIQSIRRRCNLKWNG